MTIAALTIDILMFPRYDPRPIYSDAVAVNPGILFILFTSFHLD